MAKKINTDYANSFNSQPPEGGWDVTPVPDDKSKVSTHSRPKAAGLNQNGVTLSAIMFQLTAARRRLDSTLFLANRTPTVSTHSRPKAAG